MKIYKNISGLEFVVVENYVGRRVLVKFLGTGSLVKADGRNIAAGKIADPYFRSRLGVGYLGDYIKYPYHKRALQLWSNMLKRCYDKKDPKGYYKRGVIVDARWHCFANFLEDIKHLEGFNHWSENKGYQLDKDFNGDGMTYSRETCAFIPEAVNKAAGKGGKKLVNGQWVTTIV